MPSWVTDLSHLPSEDADVPGSARLRAAFMRAVVEAATSRCTLDEPWLSAVRCIGRVGRRTCGACVEVAYVEEPLEVRWRCAKCGDQGTVSGWLDTEWDLSPFEPWDEEVPWGLDEEERAFLLEATRRIPELRAVIARATPRRSQPELFVVEAMVGELDELYTLVEELTDEVRGRRERELLDGLRASLCTSMDGW
jgi:hypothetical protein